MNSSVPYLMRAINEWILDNGCTPYLILDIAVDGVSVPMEYAKDGQIVLNISPVATRNLCIDADGVAFSGRFNGIAYEIYAPITAVLGIVAKENGEGMWFPKETTEGESGSSAEEDDQTPPDDTPPDDSPKGPPNLKVIK